MSQDPIATWHRIVERRDASGLGEVLDDDAIFLSPIVQAPQRGKAITKAYLAAALQVFANPTFRYVRQIVGPSDAMLEFETTIDGVLVNGVDLIRWNAAGKITEFKVMVRPLKAIEIVHQRMGAMLAAARQPPGAG